MHLMLSSTNEYTYIHLLQDTQSFNICTGAIRLIADVLLSRMIADSHLRLVALRSCSVSPNCCADLTAECNAAASDLNGRCRNSMAQQDP